MAVEANALEGLFAARTRGEVGEGIASILALANAEDVVSFAGGFPDPATFPRDSLAEIFGELLDDPTAFQYAPVAGLPGCREAIAGRIERLEGVRPADDELLVTSGGIEALELTAKSLLDPGDTVVVEGPTYLGAIMAFRGFEAQVVAVPMDEEGLRVDELERLLAAGLRPKLLYTIPDHQNPAGVTLAEERRPALVELARRYGFLVFEDVAYRELGFDDRRETSLWPLAPDAVVQAGTFSKTFFPGVRLGWTAGPRDVTARLTAAKQNTDQCAGALGQRLLEEHERRGLLDPRIARSRELYARRRALTLAAFERHLAGRAEWTRPRGGFFTWVTFPEGVDAVDLAARALEAGVAFAPGALFYPDGRGAHEARFSFSKVRDEAIDEGISRLAALL